MARTLTQVIVMNMQVDNPIQQLIDHGFYNYKIIFLYSNHGVG